MKLTWVNDNKQYSNGKNLYLGKWLVGGVHWDSMRSKGDPTHIKPQANYQELKLIMAILQQNKKQ